MVTPKRGFGAFSLISYTSTILARVSIGTVIDGKVDTVLSRGTVVIENDAYKGRKGHGRYVRRGLSQYLL